MREIAAIEQSQTAQKRSEKIEPKPIMRIRKIAQNKNKHCNFAKQNQSRFGEQGRSGRSTLGIAARFGVAAAVTMLCQFACSRKFRKKLKNSHLEAQAWYLLRVF